MNVAVAFFDLKRATVSINSSSTNDHCLTKAFNKRLTNRVNRHPTLKPMWNHPQLVWNQVCLNDDP